MATRVANSSVVRVIDYYMFVRPVDRSQKRKEKKANKNNLSEFEF